MAYLVSITARAARDLAQLYDDINAPDSDAARRWYEGLKQVILSLEEFPRRCAATPENRQFRNLLYGNKPHNLSRNLPHTRKKEASGDPSHPARGETEIQGIGHQIGHQIGHLIGHLKMVPDRLCKFLPLDRGAYALVLECNHALRVGLVLEQREVALRKSAGK